MCVCRLTGSDLDGARDDRTGPAVGHAPVRGRVHFRRVLVFGERREHQRAVVVHAHQLADVPDRRTVAGHLPADQRSRRAFGRALHAGPGGVREEYRDGRFDDKTRPVLFAAVTVRCGGKKKSRNVIYLFIYYRTLRSKITLKR